MYSFVFFFFQTITEDEDDYVNLVDSSTCTEKVEELNEKDEQLLDFYSTQLEVAAPRLSEAITAFITSIHQNDPPQEFNSHLRYVILLAHKLVFAGDTIHRNIDSLKIKLAVETLSNELNDNIKMLHLSSKVATKEFPQVGPMQRMVDNIWNLTKSATSLKKAICNATG